MKKIVTAKQMQALDRFAIEKLGIPSLALMETAGKAVADEVIKTKKKYVCIVCGVGNNGGDGFVAARHLLNAGIFPKVLVVGEALALKADPRVYYNVLKKLKVPLRHIKKTDAALIRTLANCDVIVDALFGVGFARKIKEPFFDVIEAINKSKGTVIAVDVPSGCDATSGEVFGVCVKAKTTVTFGCIKKGLLIKYGRKFSGKVILADIGIPNKMLSRAKR